MTLTEALQTIDYLAMTIKDEAAATKDEAQRARLSDLAAKLIAAAIEATKWASAERLTVRTAALNILRATGDYEDGAK